MMSRQFCDQFLCRDAEANVANGAGRRWFIHVATVPLLVPSEEKGGNLEQLCLVRSGIKLGCLYGLVSF